VPPVLSSIPASEARRRLSGWLRPPGVESVELSEAAGRVLAAEVRAAEPVPAFPRAAMDGYAVRAVDIAAATADAPVVLRLTGRVTMGEAPGIVVGPGEALAISTGGHVPAGADAVVMIEDTRCDVAAGAVDLDPGRAPSTVQVLRPVPTGRHVVAVGEEFAAAAPVMAPGQRLGAPQIAVLATFGLARLPVFARPRVAIASTGAELCPTQQAPAPGKIRDVNQPALAAAVRAAGGIATPAGIFPEEPQALGQGLAALLADHDLVIVTGGSSVGAKDFTAEAVRRLGAELLFHGLDVRPGRPTLAARLKGRPILGLPGVPAAALTIFQIFGDPLLSALQGEAADSRPRRSARLEVAYTSRRGREDYLRVQLVARDGETWARVLPGPTALAPLARSHGLAIIPEAAETLPAGAPVEILLR
jgi:molybdopterin molybdotransferase